MKLILNLKEGCSFDLMPVCGSVRHKMGASENVGFDNETYAWSNSNHQNKLTLKTISRAVSNFVILRPASPPFKCLLYRLNYNTV